MAASKDMMERLHTALATELATMLSEGCTEVTKDGEVVKVSPPSSTLNVIRQFLKDNGIESELTNSKPLQSVVAGLPFEGEAEIHQFPAARH